MEKSHRKAFTLLFCLEVFYLKIIFKIWSRQAQPGLSFG